MRKDNLPPLLQFAILSASLAVQSPTAWTQARFSLPSLPAQPGQIDVRMPITVATGERGLLSWALLIRYDPTALKVQDIVNAWSKEHWYFIFEEYDHFDIPGVVAAAAAYDYDYSNASDFIPPETEAVIATVNFCVLSTAREGAYPIEFIADAPRRSGGCSFRPAPCRYVDGSSDFPQLIPGSIQVSGPALDSETCIPDYLDNLPVVGSPGAPAHFRLASLTVQPGQTDVSMPITVVTGDQGLVSWYLLLRYDPAVLAVRDIASVWDKELFFFIFEPNDQFAVPGVVGAGAVYNQINPNDRDFIPRQAEVVVATANFCVLSTAREGAYPIEFIAEAPRRSPFGLPRPAWAGCQYEDGLGNSLKLTPGSIQVRAPALASGTCAPDNLNYAPPVGPPGMPVHFRLNSRTAQPGQMDVKMPVIVIPGEQGVVGWSLVLRYDPAALAVRDIASVWDKELFFFIFEPNGQFAVPGVVGAGASYKILTGDFIPPGVEAAVATVNFCVLSTAREGTYPIEFIAEAPRRFGFGPPLRTIYAGAIDGLVHDPLLSAGSIQVIGPALVPSSCPPDDFDYTPPADVPPVVTYGLTGPKSAVTGSQFSVDLTISTNLGLISYVAAIDFDEAVLAFQEAAIRKDWFGPNPFEFVFAEPGNIGLAVKGNVRFYLPPGIEQPVATLTFKVREDAPLGKTVIAFPDRLESSSGVFRNAVSTIFGEIADPLTDSSSLVEVAEAVGMKLAIVGDLNAFRRGDANGDLEVDITDAIFILRYLFLGQDWPDCMDAADVNDSGEVDISDPIYLLTYLFIGSARIPPPFGYRDRDPTADDLGCRN